MNSPVTLVTVPRRKWPHTRYVPIKSYIAWPRTGSGAALTEKLATLPGCEVHGAENRDILLLITDTRDDSAEDALQTELGRIEALECLTLVAGVGEA